LRYILIAGALALMLTGCGGGSAGIVPEDPSTSVSPTPVGTGTGTSGPPVSSGTGSSTDPAPDPGDTDVGSSHGDPVDAGGSDSSGALVNQSPGGSGHS